MFDTKEEIEKSLASLESFNSMLAQRHDAYYNKKMTLNQFYVWGRFYLDSCGNCLTSDRILTSDKVLTSDEFTLLKLGHVSFNFNNEIPPANKICPICKKEWTIETFTEAMKVSDTIVVSLKDFVGRALDEVRSIYAAKPEALYIGQREMMIRNDRLINLTPEKDYPSLKVNQRGWVNVDNPYIIQEGDDTYFNVYKFFHKKCYSIETANIQLERFKGLFKKSGFENCTFSPIPNPYCSCERCTSWYEVQTPSCDFVIGDRKRVTHLEWTADINGDKLFKNENVTTSSRYIHAWTDEKVIEYLTKIKSEL